MIAGAEKKIVRIKDNVSFIGISKIYEIRTCIEFDHAALKKIHVKPTVINVFCFNSKCFNINFTPIIKEIIINTILNNSRVNAIFERSSIATFYH